MDTAPISFELDGQIVSAQLGETLWQVAARLGKVLPHLCHRPEPQGYRPDGNCRACVVEIEGERVLAPSCSRRPAQGMKVKTDSERVRAARRMVFELLLADQPPRTEAADPDAPFWLWAEKLGLGKSRLPAALSLSRHSADKSHPAILFRKDACIHCGLCHRACREVQGNDVIGMMGRGAGQSIGFDLDDPMGQSRCVGCGECVAACPSGALLPSSLVDPDNRKRQAKRTSVDTLCPYCGAGCQLRVSVEGEGADRRISASEGRDGPANHGRLCVKGRFGFDYIHHPERLTQPLIRKKGVGKDPSQKINPADPFSVFRLASWDEALALAADGLLKIRDRAGGSALAGFGSAKGSNEEAYLFQKLVRTAFQTNNVDHCTRLCHASSVAALMEGIGSGAVTAPVESCSDSDVILVIGANPTVNHPVPASFIKNAADRGAKLIVLDPRGQALKSHAHRMVAFHPGSDVALLNAIMHVIVVEKLYDAEFLAARTEGFADFARHLVAYTPEAVAPICGVAPQLIREIARLFARARAAMIFWGMGISQHTHGTDNARCLIALALLCGHIGKPGAGLHPLRGQNNVQGASDAGLIPMYYPDYRPVDDTDARARFESLWGASLQPERGLTVVETLDAAAAGRIKGMYILGENPAMSDPDVDHARQALAALDHLVVQDIFLTETAMLADVVLPASAFFEKTGSFTNTDRRVQMGRAALDPPGEARRDFDILIALARRLGLAWDYTHPKDVFAEMQAAMSSLAHISWERLEREHAVTYPCDGPDQAGRALLFADRFPTPSGKARLVPAIYRAPAETPDADFPLVLSTGRMLEHWHTGAMTRRAEVLNALEPAPLVLMAPTDVARLGIAPGSRVRVITRRGEVELTARQDADMPPGMLFIPFCYAEAPANRLTNPALDPFGKIPELKYCAARIELT